VFICGKSGLIKHALRDSAQESGDPAFFCAISRCPLDMPVNVLDLSRATILGFATVVGLPKEFHVLMNG